MRPPWVAIDIGMARHPKLLSLGPLAPMAYAQFVAIIAYSHEFASDGHVPVGAAQGALPWAGVTVDDSPVTGGLICEALERVGLLEGCPDEPHCLVVHNYLLRQQAAADIPHLSEVRRAAGRVGGQHSAARRAAKQNPKQVLEAKRKQNEICFEADGEPEGIEVAGPGTLDLSGQANPSKTPSKCSSKTQAKFNHNNHDNIDIPSTAYLVGEAIAGQETDHRDHEVRIGEVVEAPDYVATYVRAAEALGVSPIPATKARVGKAAKELAAAGKGHDLILAAIERLVQGNKVPTALPYLLADLERERAGHSSGGRGRLSAGAQQTEEFIQRVLARRQEAAS